MNKQEHQEVLEKQIIELQKLIPYFKVKYMWGWLERFWKFGAFILGYTVFVKRSLGPVALQGLVAHDADHVIFKKTYGLIPYSIMYLFSKQFRAAVEVRGYALSCMVAEGQGYLYEAALRKYSYMLFKKYKLNMPKADLRELIDDTVTITKNMELITLYQNFACWKRVRDGWV